MRPATETIHLPRPSWAPAFLAFGLTLAVAGLYLEFMGPGWAYSVIGAVIAVAAATSMISGAERSFFSLPRRQRARSATLPAGSIRPHRSRR